MICLNKNIKLQDKYMRIEDKDSSMLDQLILEDTGDLEEVVIGLVGAIGSNINILQNILKTELEDTFNIDVFVIKISEDILKNHPNIKSIEDYDLTTKYKRINSLMNLGNKLREFYGLDYISLEVAAKIRELRKNYNGSKKRVAYIIDSLKHDAEVVSLKKLYGHTFFQISIFESEKKRKDTLNNSIGMTIEEAEKLIKRDEKEDDKCGQRTSVAFPLADYFVKFDDKSGIHINNAINRFLKLILGNAYITPTFSEFATYMAFMSSLRSSDLSRQVGAVIAKDDNILSIGSNDVPKFGGGIYIPTYNEDDGVISDDEHGRDYKKGHDCNHFQKNALVDSIYNSIKIELNDILSEDIPSQEKSLLKIKSLIENSEIKDITEYGRMVHAEMDAILNCARSNNSTQGATLYVTTFPCHNCAKHIVAAGIKEVMFVEPYPKSKALDFHDDSITLEKGEANKLRFKPFVGIGPRNFANLFSLSLGIGTELTRKNSKGKSIENDWCPKTAKLRIKGNPSTYKAYETAAESKINIIRNEVGR